MRAANLVASADVRERAFLIVAETQTVLCSPGGIRANCVGCCQDPVIICQGFDGTTENLHGLPGFFYVARDTLGLSSNRGLGAAPVASSDDLSTVYRSQPFSKEYSPLPCMRACTHTCDHQPPAVLRT